MLPRGAEGELVTPDLHKACLFSFGLQFAQQGGTFSPLPRLLITMPATIK
jgi:hypothetical protein